MGIVEYKSEKRKNNMKEVAILVVTYNRISLLQECIESLRIQTFHDKDIIVVNNGSTDGTLEWLNQQKDIITITQENLGGAGGFYTGLKYIAEQGYNYCWLMDDDVICNNNALEYLLDAAHKYPESGFFCSRVLGTNMKPMNVPSVDDRSKNDYYPDWFDKIDEGLIKVKAATFVSVLIPISRVIEVGLPLKEYFIWGDDAEYTLRLSSSHDCYLVIKSRVIHKRVIQKSLSFSEERDPIRFKNFFYLFRNSFANAKRYGSIKDIIVTICYHLILFLQSLVKLNFKKMYLLMRVFTSYLTFHPKIHYVKK